MVLISKDQKNTLLFISTPAMAFKNFRGIYANPQPTIVTANAPMISSQKYAEPNGTFFCGVMPKMIQFRAIKLKTVNG